MPRLALAALACASALLTQPACESCAFILGALTIHPTFRRADPDGEPLDQATFTTLRDAAKISQCIPDDDGEQCNTVYLDDADDNDAGFTIRAGSKAYENGLGEPGRCSYPDIRVTIQIPGCEPGEYELLGGPTTKTRHETDESLTLACTPE